MISVVLKAIRLANNDRVNDVAARAECTAAYICSVEAGKRDNISLQALKKMAIGYNIPLGTFILLEEIQEKYNLNYQQTLFMVLSYYLYGEKEFLNYLSNFLHTEDNSSSKSK